MYMSLTAHPNTQYVLGPVFICDFKDGYCVDEPVQIAVVSSSPWGTGGDGWKSGILRMRGCGDVNCAASVYDNIEWIESVLGEIMF